MDANTQKAIQTTLKMLTSEDVSTPNAWNSDLAAMQGILVAVIQGTWQLQPTPPPEKKPEEPPEGDKEKDKRKPH